MHLSLIVLTWNEEANIAACLRSLAAQTEPGFDVILIDAASTDRTLDIVRALAPTLPFRLAVHALPDKVPIGEARNLGVALARTPWVAFVSADAELDSHWVREAVHMLRTHDMAFGAQLHVPHTWTTGAAVRGLRYHFPTTRVADPLPYASNVAAAYRREVLERFPFDPWANAAEDLLLAKRAMAAGYTATYSPGMLVRHHDVATSRVEMRKNVREGRGCALYVRELGLLVPWLAWGAALLGAAVLAAVEPRAWTFGLLALTVWAPALRRALGRHRHMPASALVRGVAATPVFDLAFLANYVAGLAGRRPATAAIPPSQETHP